MVFNFFKFTNFLIILWSFLICVKFLNLWIRFKFLIFFPFFVKIFKFVNFSFLLIFLQIHDFFFQIEPSQIHNFFKFMSFFYFDFFLILYFLNPCFFFWKFKWSATDRSTVKRSERSRRTSACGRCWAGPRELG